MTKWTWPSYLVNHPVHVVPITIYYYNTLAQNTTKPLQFCSMLAISIAYYIYIYTQEISTVGAVFLVSFFPLSLLRVTRARHAITLHGQYIIANTRPECCMKYILFLLRTQFQYIKIMILYNFMNFDQFYKLYIYKKN